MSTIKFSVRCEVPVRWVPIFLGLLRTMQTLGQMGGTRTLAFLADGDGDFRPKFEWDKDLPAPDFPVRMRDEPIMFDADEGHAAAIVGLGLSERCFTHEESPLPSVSVDATQSRKSPEGLGVEGGNHDRLRPERWGAYSLLGRDAEG